MGSISETTIAFGLLRYLGFLIAITMCQAGVAIMAKRKGDNSIQTQQMATLNPLPHIDILGTVIFPIITILLNSPVVFGWPKQFDIDRRSFRNPRKDINIVYSFGVGINFAIAFLCILILRFSGIGAVMPTPTLDFTKPELLSGLIVTLIGISNITIGALFLLPLPGMAGWNILINNLSYNKAKFLNEKATIISIVGLLLIVSGVLTFYFRIFLFLFLFGTY
ncbi:site-2 protease family protein [Fluviispira multicolorata]|uniref:Zn-dependent protease (Includes SpoIVFB) n=1 Tax=Fluviispira multicolorata TaxID=2654512 RepID=A0A833JB51_9BACT|nr:site-2 protease family protein [Fluviispira multicolorata]KAB8029057.1 hypothetical protein GCL57_10985 [Fluviispira multicolorata]